MQNGFSMSAVNKGVNVYDSVPRNYVKALVLHQIAFNPNDNVKGAYMNIIVNCTVIKAGGVVMDDYEKVWFPASSVATYVSKSTKNLVVNQLKYPFNM